MHTHRHDARAHAHAMHDNSYTHDDYQKEEPEKKYAHHKNPVAVKCETCFIGCAVRCYDILLKLREKIF